MKLQGHDLSKETIEYVVLPRGYDPETGEKVPDVVFHCRVVRSFRELDALVKRPDPPHVIRKGGVKEYNYEDETYKMKLQKFQRARYDYIVLHSLSATPGLEWDTVKMPDPDTWANWEDELRDAGFSDVEMGKIQDGVMQANGFSNQRLEEALADFLRGQAEA